LLSSIVNILVFFKAIYRKWDRPGGIFHLNDNDDDDDDDNNNNNTPGSAYRLQTAF
jgi:hypothetical protein